MGHPNLRVELMRALKTGVRDLYTCTRAPPVYSFERGMVVEGLTILLNVLWVNSLPHNCHSLYTHLASMNFKRNQFVILLFVGNFGNPKICQNVIEYNAT